MNIQSVCKTSTLHLAALTSYEILTIMWMTSSDLNLKLVNHSILKSDFKFNWISTKSNGINQD